MPGGGILAMSMLVLLLLVAWGIFVLCSHLVVPVGSPPTLQVRSATALTEQQLLPQEQRRFPPKSWNNSANKTHTIAPGSSNNNDAPQEAEVDGSSSGSSNHYRETNEENDVVDPFPPPLYGYQSLLEMKGRHQRFPSVPERVQVYMSNWYLPPCQHQPQQQRDPEKEDGFIHYSFVDNIDATTEGGASSSSGRLLLVREVETVTSFYRADDDDDEKNSYSKNSRRRQTFRLDSNTTLGRLHFIVREKMIPEHCDSEYCVDILKHWVPAVDRVVGLNTSTAVSPVLFQFSDEELSRAMSASTHELVPHPNVPHLKKSRLALLRLRRQQPQAPLLPINTYDCSVIPKPFLPTAVVSDEDIHGHLHPIIFKLKTNRHYGMIGRIPPLDIPWSRKKDMAIFRGTLTGFLPPNSRFTLSTRRSHALTLSDTDAEEKCTELDRCRMVYHVNRFYNNNEDDDDDKQQQQPKAVLVDTKLVHPMLQHIDMPNQIYNVPLFGNRMTKQDLLKYKAIIMLEGNDAGTGFKWGLFSNSVVMTMEPPKFTSWAMEELLEPWVHYVPLCETNGNGTKTSLAQDVHDKMQWVLDHDEQAQEIARRGSLWIRDLLLHPDATPDDEAISDDMVRRYMAHFVQDEDLML